MTLDLAPLKDYLKTLGKKLAAGDTTEHSHRPALEALLQNSVPGITAINEPTHIIKVGAPDFKIVRNHLTIGYVECKDIGVNLDETLQTDQLQRYLKSFDNLILTNYLEFRWFVAGKHRLTVWLGSVTGGHSIKPAPDGLAETAALLADFLSQAPAAIGNSRELASHLARLAHIIRNTIIQTLGEENLAGSLHAQMAAFRETLIPDLSVAQFADMYAQTIAYGLFAARCEDPFRQDFTRQQASFLIPKTNPFLRKLFAEIAGPDLDERITWAVDDLAQILRVADMPAVLANFGKSQGKDDPVVHFYETFLKEYDPETREMRGVYYTPLPVVSYIVRAIDHILKTSFGQPQGLADPGVLVLDPAAGTGTFLYYAIRQIYEKLLAQGQPGAWNDYVKDKLLPRLFGFELLMAPYAIAHLKLGLLLKETGYDVENDKRLNIYLTNTLEEAVKKSEKLAGFNQYIVEEADAAADVKKNKPIMVVMGNPPYSGHSANKGKWARQLVERYKTVDGQPLGEKNPKWLQDDYVKFLAFGQWRIEHTGQGILGFITNHSYLDNPTFRGMRQSLMHTFTDIYILNLHGNAKKKEVAPDGGKDENVFDIQQGVAIGIFVKEAGKEPSGKVHYADLWGLREGKYQSLLETEIVNTVWAELKPSSPFYLFLPLQEDRLAEYEKGWKVTDIFPVNSVGIVTSRDDFVFDFDDKALINRIQNFRQAGLSDEEIRTKYDLKENKVWNVADARAGIRKDEESEKAFTKCLYRPFDIRPLFYHKAVIERSRPEVMRHMLAGENIALITSRMTKGETYQHTLVSKTISEVILLSPKTSNNAFVFPLYLYPAAGEMQFEKGKRHPNLNPAFIKAFSDKLSLEFVDDGKGDLAQTFGPEDIFNYAYAVFHSPTYRTRYAEFLKIDFPRLPLTSDRELFKALAGKGAALVALHLMESPLLNNLITRYPISGGNRVEKVTYNENEKRVYINKAQYFEGVEPEVWNFHIGGYQVCEKWLKDRKGRPLTYDELTHYQKIIVALKETIRLMSEIDGVITHWPIA